MNSTSQSVIAIRRPDDWLGRCKYSFTVRIDGREAGQVKPGLALRGPTEFTVAPGEHTVIVSIDWFRSRPCQLAVAPGSRTELVLRGRSGKFAWWKNAPRWERFLGPTWFAVLSISLFTDKLTATVLLLSLLVPLLACIGFVLVTSMFVTDYWVMWTLEPVGTTQAAPGTSLSDEAGMK